MLLSYRTAGLVSPVLGCWNMVTFLRKEKETFWIMQTPFTRWKMCSNCHNHVLKINICESLKLLLLDIFWFYDKWKWWRRRKRWREVGYTSLFLCSNLCCNTNTSTFLVLICCWGHYVGIFNYVKDQSGNYTYRCFWNWAEVCVFSLFSVFLNLRLFM